MKSYADLSGQERSQPCLEFPGKFIVFINGGDEVAFNSLSAAIEDGNQKAARRLPDETISIAWQASWDDPRKGHLWFVGFYRHGHYDQFGRYVKTHKEEHAAEEE